MHLRVVFLLARGVTGIRTFYLTLPIFGRPSPNGVGRRGSVTTGIGMRGLATQRPVLIGLLVVDPIIDLSFSHNTPLQ